MTFSFLVLIWSKVLPDSSFRLPESAMLTSSVSWNFKFLAHTFSWRIKNHTCQSWQGTSSQNDTKIPPLWNLYLAPGFAIMLSGFSFNSTPSSPPLWPPPISLLEAFREVPQVRLISPSCVKLLHLLSLLTNTFIRHLHCVLARNVDKKHSQVLTLRSSGSLERQESRALPSERIRKS